MNPHNAYTTLALFHGKECKMVCSLGLMLQQLHPPSNAQHDTRPEQGLTMNGNDNWGKPCLHHSLQYAISRDAVASLLFIIFAAILRLCSILKLLLLNFLYSVLQTSEPVSITSVSMERRAGSHITHSHAIVKLASLVTDVRSVRLFRCVL